MVTDFVWENPNYSKEKLRVIIWVMAFFSIFIACVVLYYYVHDQFFIPAVIILVSMIIPLYFMYNFRIKVPKKIIFADKDLHIENMDPKGIKISYDEINSIERLPKDQIMISMDRMVHLSKNLRLYHIEDICFEELNKRTNKLREKQ